MVKQGEEMKTKNSILGILNELHPKIDLRSKPICANCGAKITKKNFGMADRQFENGSFSKPVYLCIECLEKGVSIDKLEEEK